ncbi:hypothetical protein N7G274_005440 [Stereocaulon virgatum]|uniref:Small ribosomal subunit protein mS33 n=1 Tax=Stereocaulon virgatum TaxID=373712 RepID=A0ABR4A9T5_9LECA
MAVPQSRLQALHKLQTTLFSQTYNPQHLRTGNKILRQRLRGPAIASYYPRRLATMKDLKNAYKNFEVGVDMQTWDEEEEERLERVGLKKLGGKGAPKKKGAPKAVETKDKKRKK